MKNIIQSLSLALLLIITALSCTTEEVVEAINDNPASDAPVLPTSEEFNSLKNVALDSLRQNFTFDAADGYISLTSEKGVQISLNTNCLTKNGNAVTGSIDFEFIEIFDRSSMLSTDRPTVGLTESNDKAMLISGGEFYISATKDGEALATTCDLNLLVPADLTGGVDSEMTLWKGIEEEDGQLVWVEEETPNDEDDIFAEGENYYVVLGDFGWTNIDKFYSDPSPKTTILVDVPEGYNNANSAVYLSYVGESSSLALLDTYDSNTELFSEHYGQIPIGLSCHLIFVTEEAGEWRYAIKAVTIAADSTIVFTLSETITGTEEVMKQAIKDLP